MSKWWEPDLPVILAALRQLRRGQRVYIHISAAGWRVLTLLAVLAIVTACASDPAPTAQPDPAAIAQAVQATVAALPQPAPVQVEVTRIVEVPVEVTRIVEVAIPPTPTPEPAAPAIGQIGQRVEAGGIAMIVNSITTNPNPSQFSSASEGKTYLIVDVLIENTSAEPLSYNPYYFTVKDSNSYEYSGGETVPDPRFSSGQLAPGDSVRGLVGFEIPISAAGLVLTHDIMGRFQPVRVALEDAR